MKKFKDLRETIKTVELSEKSDVSFETKDSKTAEMVKKELSKIVKADFKMNKSGSKYVVTVTPRSTSDERIVKSFLDDAEIETLKDEFISSLIRSKDIREEYTLKNSSGEEVTITPEISEKIVHIHDNLSRDNQEVFMDMLVHSRETFEQVVNFCESYSKR